MSNLDKYQKHLENLSCHETTVNFILEELGKMSRMDKMKALAEMLLVKKIRGVKHRLPEDEYRQQLLIAEQIVSPIGIVIIAELGNSGFSLNLQQSNIEEPTTINKQEFLENFDTWN